MSHFLESPCIRKTIREPIVTDWVLQRLWHDSNDGLAAPLELQRGVFDEATIRQILEAGEDELQNALFTALAPECFEGVIPVLEQRWPFWQGAVANNSADVLLKLAPKKALKLFEAYLYTPSVWEDPKKTAAVGAALEDMASEGVSNGALPLVHRILECVQESAGEKEEAFAQLLSLRLAWAYRLPDFESLFVDYLQKAAEHSETESVLRSFFRVVASPTDFFIHLRALHEHYTAQSFESLALFFDAGAPLEELDKLIMQKNEPDFGQVCAFLEERCLQRGFEPLERIYQVLTNRREALPPDQMPQLGTFLLALGAASWVPESHDFSPYSAGDCVRAAAVDILEVPGYDALLTRLKAFPAGELVELMGAELDKNKELLGAITLTRLMGELGHEAFIPLVTGFLKLDLPGEFLDEIEGALLRMGAPAGKHLIDVWDQFDQTQKETALHIIARTVGEAAAGHLVQCFPEMRAEYLDIWCEAAQDVHDDAVLHAIARELHRKHPELDKTFLLLSTILGRDHESLGAVRERIEARKAHVEKTLTEAFTKGNLGESVELELKCRECGDLNYYDVQNVFVSLLEKRPSVYIADEIPCRSCGAVDCLDATSHAQLKITAQMALFAAVAQSGLTPQSPVNYITGCRVNGRLVSVSEGIDHYREAIARKPGSLTNWLALGNCYAGVGRVRQAKDCFQECLRLEPACPEAALSLAQILEDEGMLEDAFRILDAAMKHRKRWRFHRLHDVTAKKFIENFEEFHAELAYETGAKPLPAPDPYDGPVQEPVRSDKTAPNSPCPCGSGKKYKKCCGRLA